MQIKDYHEEVPLVIPLSGVLQHSHILHLRLIRLPRIFHQGILLYFGSNEANCRQLYWLLYVVLSLYSISDSFGITFR